jgi:transcriptional regulator with XRE-family HTH domain
MVPAMPDEAPIITAAQCRAARALIEWSVDELAQTSGVDANAISDFEARYRAPGEDVERRIRIALEQGGVSFIAENGGGAGVRLKFSRRDARAINRWEGEGGTVGEDDIL